MLEWYLILKWVHVLSAITAVGANITYGIWISRATRRPEMLAFTLRGIKFIDDRIANPAYGLLLITGLGMVWVGRLMLTEPWLMTALIVYGVLVLVGLLGYTPTLRRQIAALERDGADSAPYRALAGRGTQLGIALGVLAVGMVYLMVVKPALWG